MEIIELKLNSPITEEQWDTITDVDIEHTNAITFSTKHGKTVRFVKEKQPVTIGDKLRTKNDEVLAQAIYDIVQEIKQMRRMGFVIRGKEKQHILEWLQKPLEE